MSFNFNITNQCNRHCTFCFEGQWHAQGEMLMALDDIRAILTRDAEFIRTRIPRIGILGGEPTSHPDFEAIYKLISTHVRMVYVMTNGIMSESTARLIAPSMHLVNVDGPRDGKQGEQFQRTLDIWDESGMPPYAASVTIDDPDKDFTFLFDALKTYRNIQNVRIGITSPGYQFSNDPMLKTEPNLAYGEAYLRLARKLRELRPGIPIYNECCVNDYVMDDATFRTLNDMDVQGLRKVCLVPNFDIYPDLSVTWCFPFVGIPELTIPNVLEVPTLQDAFTQLVRKFRTLCEELGFDPRVTTTGCAAAEYYRKRVAPNEAN